MPSLGVKISDIRRSSGFAPTNVFCDCPYQQDQDHDGAEDGSSDRRANPSNVLSGGRKTVATWRATPIRPPNRAKHSEAGAH